MKRNFARVTFCIFALVFFLPVLGCGERVHKDIDPIKTYRDLDLSPDEKTKLEALLAGREKFVYGVELSTEAFELEPGNKESSAGFTAKFCGLLSGLFETDFELHIFEPDDGIGLKTTHSLDFAEEFGSGKAQLAKEGYFMSLPIAERMLRIYAHPDSIKTIQRETDLGGLKIGFLPDTDFEKTIREVYNLPQGFFTSVSLSDYADAATKLSEGEIHAFVADAATDPAFVKYDGIASKVFFTLIHEPICVATVKPELEIIISVLDKYLKVGGIDKLFDMYKEGEYEYAKYKLYNSFTGDEEAYINRKINTPIEVAFEQDNYPVSFYNKTTKAFEGMAVDVLNQIGKLYDGKGKLMGADSERLTDLSFVIASDKNTTWSEIAADLASDKIPMAGQVLKSEKREEDYIWSDPYGSCYYAFISKEGYPNLATFQVAYSTVGLNKGSLKVDIYQKLFPNIENYEIYDDQNACLAALEKGEIDLYFASEYSLLFLSHYLEKPGYKINLRLYNEPMDSAFGFNKNQNDLCSIIKKAQGFVDTAAIETDWIGKTFDYSTKLANQRALLFGCFSGALLVILAVTAFLFAKYVKLGNKFKKIASTDALTGIYNRRFFMEACGLQFERTIRTGGESFIIFYDLDFFKRVNDTHGHQAGDKVLKDIAQRVKKAIRPYDLFGRYGGEEFILLMTEIDKTNVFLAVERIRSEIEKAPVEFESKTIPITASFGIACAAPKNDLNTAIKQADEALYEAKRTGRNRTVFYADGGQSNVN